ncbi:hypothetical protein GEMRC1_002009 [Eukaryota sp. GEM-RC1]
MFEATLDSVSTLKKIVDAIKDLVKEANIECTLQGVSLQAMDGSHVALVSLTLRKEGFTDFTNHRNITLGVNLKNLDTILKCAGKDDTVTLSAGDKADHLDIRFVNETSGQESSFTIKLMDIDQESLGIPDQEYDTEIKLPSSEFQRICKDLGQLGDTITITTVKGAVSFSAAGDIGSGKITLQANENAEKEEERVEVNQARAVSLSFGVRYLRDFTKATSLAPQVSLKLTNNAPLIVEYNFGVLGKIAFLLLRRSLTMTKKI